MSRCLHCLHYKKFLREMEEEDARQDAEVEDIWRNPEKYDYSKGDSAGLS